MDYMIYHGSFLPPEVDYSKLGSDVKPFLVISFLVFRKPQLEIEIAIPPPFQ